jgi:putative transposase
MSANQAFFAIATMARVLGVSTAGYYAWRSPVATKLSDFARLVLGSIRRVFRVS